MIKSLRVFKMIEENGIASEVGVSVISCHSIATVIMIWKCIRLSTHCSNNVVCRSERNANDTGRIPYHFSQ